MFYRLLLLILISLLLSCSLSQDVQHRRVYVFGTLVDVSASGVSEAQFSEAMGEINAAFRVMHKNWNAWKPGLLVELNAALAKGEEVAVAGDLLWLIKRSVELSDQSGGLFNPAIGGLIAAWGFHTDDYPIEGASPSFDQLNPWLAAHPEMKNLSVVDGLLSSTNPAVQLDFGGMAKGLAVDRAMEILARHGIDNAIVNAGGDLRARGRRSDGPWRIGVRHPQGEGVIAAIGIEGDEAVFTSGNYQRFRQYNEQRWPHIIDPRTGQPVQYVASVTVIHQDASTADAAATALVVAGPDEWVSVARKMGVKSAMLVDEAGTVFLTPAMAERVTFEAQTNAVVVDYPSP